MEMTGVVLAGGRSSRMGTDKALLDWHGRPLVDHVCERLRPVCGEVLIASGDGRRLGRGGEIADAMADAGPLGGVLAALERARHELVAVVAVDLPHANGPVLRLLAESVGDASAAVPTVAGRAQPLHAVYRATCAAVLRRYLEDDGRSVMGFLDLLDVEVIGHAILAAADPDGRFALNLNLPSDLDNA